MNVHDWVLTCLRCLTFKLDHQDFHQGQDFQPLVEIECGRLKLKLNFSCSTRTNARWSKWRRSIRSSWSWRFPWCCRIRLFVRFYFTSTSSRTISKIQSNFWPDGSRISLWTCCQTSFLCRWMGKRNSILSRTSNYWPGMFYSYRTFGSPKSVKMTDIGKNRIRSPIKIGYFLSLLKFLDPNSDFESQPYLY